MLPSNDPPNWGHDEISKFIDAARGNEFATYANLKGDVARLIDIDIAYRKAIDGLNHSKDWFSGFFLLRSHSNFLAACRLSWSGQIPESYAVLRSCLENALYGLYLTHNPEARETWLRRHDSKVDKNKVRSEFKIGALLDLAKTVDKAEGELAASIYERTIDFGAHPNERALMQTLHLNEKEEHVEFKVIYLEDNTDHLKFSLKSSAEVGVCALVLFRTVYRERFDILGISDMLKHIRKGL